jgi:hypothetical protein
MTRKEKAKKVQEQDGKAFEAFKIEIDAGYHLNPKYRLLKQAATVRSDMGRLDIFEINPLGVGPSFKARWDGGSRDRGKKERNDLDIDIYGVSDEEKYRFEHNQGGYLGHRTAPNDAGRVYQVFLRTPDGVIFEGTVRFNLLRKMEFNASLRPSGDLQAPPPR